LFKTVLPIQKTNKHTTNFTASTNPPTNVQPKKQANDPMGSYGALLGRGVEWIFS
jgi:hypothetical protein